MLKTCILVIISGKRSQMAGMNLFHSLSWTRTHIKILRFIHRVTVDKEVFSNTKMVFQIPLVLQFKDQTMINSKCKLLIKIYLRILWVSVTLTEKVLQLKTLSMVIKLAFRMEQHLKIKLFQISTFLIKHKQRKKLTRVIEVHRVSVKLICWLKKFINWSILKRMTIKTF